MAPDCPGRRQFLKTAGLAALATFTGPLRSANDKPTIAFIGCGRMGFANIDFAARAGGVEIVGVCDVYRPALDRAAAQAKQLGFTGVKMYHDFREVLADKSVDAVSIATPDDWHACMTVEACKAGKDVWCETPACVYVEDGLKMVQAARQYRRLVQGGTMQRSGGFFRKARDIVKSGSLGEIAFCNNSQAGAMTGPGVDLIDMVQFAFDDAMPLSISAQGVPGTMLASYRYPGFLGAYESRGANAWPSHAYGTTFHGTRATLMVNRGGYWIWPSEKGRKPVTETSGDLAAMNVPHWKNFVECLRTRQRPASDIESWVRATTTWLLSNLALRHGVTLDWDDRAFTVKQHDIKPLLKANYGSPWKLEV